MFVSAKRKETRNNDDSFQIAVFPLSGGPSYRRLLTFVTIVKERTRACSPSSYSASARCVPCAAQHLATPTIILNFREENIRDPKSNYETHENIVPWKFGAIRCRSLYCALPRTESIFEGSLLQAARAVLLHTTAIHCHHGRDIEDPWFFVLERVLQVCPKFKVSFSQRRSRNERESWTVMKKVLKTKSL